MFPFDDVSMCGRVIVGWSEYLSNDTIIDKKQQPQLCQQVHVLTNRISLLFAIVFNSVAVYQHMIYA